MANRPIATAITLTGLAKLAFTQAGFAQIAAISAIAVVVMVAMEPKWADAHAGCRGVCTGEGH